MKKLTSVALLLGGAIMASQSVFGQPTLVADDLYMGFQNQAGGGAKDYVINLGTASNIVGGTVVVNLSSAFSLANFNTVLGASSSMFGGVIGANNSDSPSDVYLTQLRSGGAGTPAVAGSTLAATLTRGQDNSTYAAISSLNNPAAGTGVLDASKSWENQVEPTLTSGTFYGITGLNPDSSVSSSSILYENLWYTSSSSQLGGKSFNYLGYFTLDLTGGSPQLTFTPKNVPAPLTQPVILSVSYAAGTVTLVWSTVSNHTYQLQYTSSLSPTSWSNVGSAQSAVNTTMTNNSAGTDPQRFYRVQAQ
jgi:hypothetical protein